MATNRRKYSPFQLSPKTSWSIFAPNLLIHGVAARGLTHLQNSLDYPNSAMWRHYLLCNEIFGVQFEFFRTPKCFVEPRGGGSVVQTLQLHRYRFRCLRTGPQTSEEDGEGGLLCICTCSRRHLQLHNI